MTPEQAKIAALTREVYELRGMVRLLQEAIAESEGTCTCPDCIDEELPMLFRQQAH